MKIRYLLDENLPPKLQAAILRFNGAIDILRVGDPDTPPLGTLDPEVLQYLELSQRLLVTDNRRSIPGHLEDYWETGGHSWGVFWLRPSGTIRIWAEELFVIWETSEAEEWIDKVDWIPL